MHSKHEQFEGRNKLLNWGAKKHKIIVMKRKIKIYRMFAKFL